MRNVEIKAKVKVMAQLLERAKTLSRTDGEIINQHDTFYAIKQGRLKLRRFENGNAELIFYERPDINGPKLSSYEKAGVFAANVAGLHRVLDKALGSTTDVKKARHLFMMGQTRVHLDCVEGLGDFIELEVVLRPEQSPEDGEKIASELMKLLEVNNEDLISGAYADLLKEQ